jgi:two-component system, LytTR family, response regulator
MTIRALIVDDEDLARRGIRTLLKRAADVEVVAECRNGREAIEAIKVSQPNLVFLDIQMPGKTGFDVIDALGGSRCPYVVFVTAFDKFAVQAFEVHALDYVLKPINERRFYDSLERARTALAAARADSVLQKMVEVTAELRQSSETSSLVSQADRIPVKVNGNVIAVRVADIDWVEADHDYVSLHVGAKSWLLRETITAAETRLTPCGFVRIHRSVLVNLDRVRELRPLSKGEFTVVLIDGTELKLSRNYRSAVERLVGIEI